MSVDYNTSRSMKAAAIGTIMPWTGEISQIPKGWRLCNGDFIRCDEFPLLARVIRDTYGGANVNFSDTNFIFPYTGYTQAQIALPNLNQRGVADIDYNYFSNDPANRPGPQDTIEARAVVDDYIGTTSTVNANLASLDNFQAITDVNFSLSTTALTGTVEGQYVTDGLGTKSVFTMPRKLGRQHMPSHTHPTAYDSIITSDQSTPGIGPGVYATDSISITADLFGDLFGDFLLNTNTSWSEPSNPFSNGPGRYILGSMNGGEPLNNYKPFTSQSSWHGIKQWFTDSQKNQGRSPDGTTSFPSRIWDGFINTGDRIPFGDNNEAVQAPNFDPGTSTIGGVTVAGSDNADLGSGGDGRGTLYDHAARSFTIYAPNSTPNSQIFTHTHEDFDVVYDQASSRIKESKTVDVTTGLSDPLTPNNLPSAFIIDYSVQSPSMSTLYLIRAY